MRDAAADERMPVGLEERGEKAVHALEDGKAEEDVAAECLETAAGVRTAIMQERPPETVGEPRRRPGRPRSPRVSARGAGHTYGAAGP